MCEIVAVAWSVLQCAGGIIPQEVKEKLTSPVSQIFLYRSNAANIRTKIEELKRAKVELEATLLVAQTNGYEIRDAIQTWLNATDKMILEFEIPEGDKCFCCGSSACQASKMLDEIKKALEQSNDFKWVSDPAGSTPPPIGSRYHAYNKNLRSREIMLVSIFKTLEKSNMIGICGIPGVGKTILLEELIKRAEADNLFQVIAKLDLSQGLDTKMIQASIASRIQLDMTVCGDDEETRANLLYRGLLYRKSRILFIFDHVCSVTDFGLTEIGIPFPLDGCKILVSARSSDVCIQTVGSSNIVQLDCLSLAEAKILFRDKLGNQIPDEEYNSEAYISNENNILQRCGNLPMAIAATAEALKVRWSTRGDIVRDIRKYDLSQDDGVKKTLNHVNKMWLNLIKDDREKKIFLLCCLFKPGTSIPVESLIRYGIGLKLFSTVTKLEDIMDQANMLVNRLESLRLLESRDGYIGMNAILHEFAISLALEDKYILIDEGDRNNDTRENFTIISSTTKPEIHGSESAHRQLEGLNFPKLEAMFLRGGFLNLKDFKFKEMTNLRVLVMTEMKLLTLPVSYLSLCKLITFCAEYCEIQKTSTVSYLSDLEVLSFHGSKLKSFYIGNIKYLRKLRVLDLGECCFGTSPDDVEELIRELKYFNQLEALDIEIPSINSGDFSLNHNLPRFKIAIGCKVPSPYRNLPDRVLLLQDIDERICMQQGLQLLLKRAELLKLVEINDLRSVYYHLDSKGFVDLKFMQIISCNQMKCVLNGNGDVDINILPKLETLSLENLDGLEVIYTGRMPQNWCSPLRELKLLNLKELKCYALLIEHARKLVVVEVTDCPKLNYFFSTYSTSENSPTGDSYGLPSLKKLALRSLPALKGMLTDKKQETDIKDQTDQLLFHEKISLISLEELYLSRLDNIKELWSEKISEGSSPFRSLKEIIIDDCILLESLCTPSVLAALSGLVTLQISSSSNMKEVIKSETNSENAIKFPSLRRMELRELQRLQWFSQGSCTAEFPSLEKLSLSSLPKMLSFHESEQSDGRQTPFFTEIVFPNLEHLKLIDMEGIEELVEEEHCATAFPELKTLTIAMLNNLKLIPVAQLKKLEELEVNSCGSLRSLFDGSFPKSMLQLARLELVDVSCRENVPWKSIPNIESLVIRRSLLNLQCMVSSTEILGSQVAQKLSYMEIEGCEHLKEIVSNECDQQDQGDLEYGTAMFPQLKHIKFLDLPSITTFSSGEYDTTFPLLEEVEITGCPELKSFSFGTLHTVYLSTLILDGVPILNAEQEIDLNSILEHRNQGMPDDEDDEDDNDGGEGGVGGVDDERELSPSESRLATDDGGDAESAASNDDEHEMHQSRPPLLIADNGDAGSAAAVADDICPSESQLTTNDNGDAHSPYDEREMCPSKSKLTTNDDGDADSSVTHDGDGDSSVTNDDDDDDQEMHPSNSPLVINDDGAADSAASATAGANNGDDHTSHNLGAEVKAVTKDQLTELKTLKNGSIIN